MLLLASLSEDTERSHHSGIRPTAQFVRKLHRLLLEQPCSAVLVLLYCT